MNRKAAALMGAVVVVIAFVLLVPIMPAHTSIQTSTNCTETLVYSLSPTRYFLGFGAGLWLSSQNSCDGSVAEMHYAFLW